MICHSLAQKIAQYCLQENKTCNIIEIQYGLELMLESIWKIIGLVIIGSIFGKTFEMLMSISCFSILRHYAGGIHMKTSWGCFFMMIAVGLVPAYLKDTNMLTIEWNILLLLAAYGIVWRYAPSLTANNPITDRLIIEKNNRIARCIVICILLYSLILKMGDMGILISVPIFIESITVLPIWKNKSLRKEKQAVHQ